MKLYTLSSFVLASITLASHEGEARMTELMNFKIKERQKHREQGLFGGPLKYPDIHKLKPCNRNRKSNGMYDCKNVDMHGFLNHKSMGSVTGEGNDVWGWTAPNGREFGAVGQTDGTAFVEILKKGKLRYVGRLDTQSHHSIWRDIKIINGYAYIGSEAEDHGMQVFDMRKLLDVGSKPKVFSNKTDLTAWFSGFGSSHNIVAHEDKNMIYAVGTKRNLPCAGGLFMVDVSDPSNPTHVGCASEDGYVHDAQCVTYTGPMKKYHNQEICFNYNEDSLTIVDVTNKKAPKQLSKTKYEGASYTHQGWLTDSKMTHLLLDDEEDERHHNGLASNNHTTTYVWDISNLEKPKMTGYYQSPVKSIDHNQYVVDGISYQSNYNSGLRMVDVSMTTADPSGNSFRELGHFDIHPFDDDAGGELFFSGSWSVYPYFSSGYILLNGIERGVFSLKYNPRKEAVRYRIPPTKMTQEPT